MFAWAEAWTRHGVEWLRLLVEGLGAAVIFVGFLVFQLAADILSTAVSPSWDQLGKLAVVAVIRTALNFFLTREIRDERLLPRGNREGP